MAWIEYCLSLLLGLTAICHAQQLSRCCSEGRSYFNSRSSCSGSITANFSPTCKRASSICCLRALLDSKCAQGEKVASGTGECPSALLGHLGGAIHKECCDCCLLGRELSSRGQSCIAPPGFSPACKSAFKRCCSSPHGITYVAATQTEMTPYNTDRCRTNPCDHECRDTGSREVQCTCRSGYKLNSDGRTCRVSQSCSPTKPCSAGLRCSVDETGSSECRSFGSSFDGINENECPVGYMPNPRAPGACMDLDECLEDVPVCKNANEKCLNSPGSYECYCATGYTWSEATNACIDIDECRLNIDIECITSQRCINTPGSYKCIRILACGTGYYLDSINETCNDIDECSLGTHDCMGKYTCKNTKGSFRCEIHRCRQGTVLDPRTNQCTRVECPQGYSPSRDGRCQDIDECANARRCATFQSCVNSPGSFRCEDRPNSCGNGYKLDTYSGECLDIDECQDNTHSCSSSRACRNEQGAYSCQCQIGYDYNKNTRTCEDIDECARQSGSVCSFDSRCENTQGSFRCHCSNGYRLASDGVTCEDVDECKTGVTSCQQRCINVPGSYQCICDRGYTLSSDSSTCEDINECSLWQTAGEPLCMGGCVNTQGSFTCRCPAGYELQSDQRTCRDIDECSQTTQCQGNDKICVNTLGSFKCHTIRCPANYIHDPKYKNRCNRPWPVCVTGDSNCMQQPISISYQFMALPRLRQFPETNPSIPLFTMKGPRYRTTEVQFELTLIDSIPERPGVRAATRNSFLLQKGDAHNSVVIALREPLDGAQDVKMQLMMRVFHSGIFGGKAKAVLLVHVSQFDKSEGKKI